MSRMMAGLFTGILLSAGPSAQAQTSLSATQTGLAVQLAAERGRLLYAYDQAAWHATDDLRTRYPQLIGQAGGYVVTGNASQPQAVFFDKGKTVAIYRATFRDGRMLASGPVTEAERQLTPLEERMIDARDRSLAAFSRAKVGTCGNQTPNLAVLPPTTTDGAVTAYLLTPRTNMSTIPMGGHFSVEVRPDGSVGAVRSFARSCLELPLAAPKGGTPEALMASHLLDPTPTEIHVFGSLSARLPIYVLTMSNKQLWAVSGSRIRLVDVNGGK